MPRLGRVESLAVSFWVLEYTLKSGTRVRTLPLPPAEADRQYEDCLRRGERAELLPAPRQSPVTWSQR